MPQNDLIYQKKNLPESLKRLGFILLGIGLALGLAGFLFDAQRAFFNYLLTFIFIMSIAVGSLFLIALEYIAGAEWSTPIRRIPEFFASSIPLLFVLVIPLLLNIHSIFEWSQKNVVAGDKILTGKSPYLNASFFVIRTILTIGIWSLFYFLFVRNSRKQDVTKDQLLTKKNIKLSAIFIPVFAITVTLAAIDWLMSLAPHWFSTIFGIYFFAGSFVAALAAVTLAIILLKEKGYLHPRMTNEHLFSLGALQFTFINFWAYIAFSQFMLIWYANLPEETVWFIARWGGMWTYISLGLIFAHFLVPYAVLLSQPAKMDPKRLKFISIWILAAHALDLYWLIMPQVHTANAGILSIVFEFGFLIAAVGGFLLVFYFNAKKHNLVPVGDPKLEKGLNFRL
ncbi:MAG: quinol:cytochrome C oxidoreductase [Ignavibacteria bacterium CG_4_8_14_3_um_filter_37_9]|nr:quinol:cytochrome C oxidoreductase [Ignavibacteria bacterium]PIP79434.1 MAG: quinol:cytochrome C oxidoreductase [Ignavibacteria bacterium CG22_combo_CG10-13_8_21_14_all_37_15]PIW98510.1 MAG: quinol:cytochrome C oxidoreductase [Ignavibacteria bacterium CG_4_8_14_3_um_filter_37_9]PJC57126.1 MAG: quinol:cytochrome C oxidoreductase [Ignavibacteria bacterium CG_4_9_14_0_2_um_filter_37_13]